MSELMEWAVRQTERFSNESDWSYQFRCAQRVIERLEKALAAAEQRAEDMELAIKRALRIAEDAIRERDDARAALDTASRAFEIQADTQKTHCPKGHPFSGTNLTRWSKGPKRPNSRGCRKCNSHRLRVARAARKTALGR